MITQIMIDIAIARRDWLADEIQDYCRHLPFEKCFQLCAPALREQYVAANRVACFMEKGCAFFELGFYRLPSGEDIWHTGHKWGAQWLTPTTF